MKLNLTRMKERVIPPLCLLSTANEDSVVGSYYPLRVGGGVLLGLVKAEEHTEGVVELLAGASPESGRILAGREATTEVNHASRLGGHGGLR